MTDWPPKTRVERTHYYARLTCVACPTQWEGRWACNDRPFYFRARDGQWTLHVGPKGAPTAYELWASWGLVILSGVDPSGGSMDDEVVLELLDLAFTPLPAEPADGGRVAAVEVEQVGEGSEVAQEGVVAPEPQPGLLRLQDVGGTVEEGHPPPHLDWLGREAHGSVVGHKEYRGSLPR